jgi:hypothetical protein
VTPLEILNAVCIYATIAIYIHHWYRHEKAIHILELEIEELKRKGD